MTKAETLEVVRSLLLDAESKLSEASAELKPFDLDNYYDQIETAAASVYKIYSDLVPVEAYRTFNDMTYTQMQGT